MKTKNILKLFIVLYQLLGYSYSQELIVTNINSPKALELNKKIENIRANLFTKMNEISTVEKKDKTKKTNENKNLEEVIDSLSSTLLKAKIQYAKEILKTTEAQEVVRNMKTALTSGVKGSSHKISMDYRQKLLDNATQRLLTKQIDRPTFKEELKAIDKIINSLEDLVYSPQERKSH